ncbi:MAG: Spx/MgsR family RNA polymerase-binding regulatory protein [Helicobacteraceae bacterium]|nr:Spx/MgsR family RNA polymerase-binding regulatory protein [Helicobacteraceae bacterium]
MVTLYGIKSCDSVKKAIKFFKENTIEYTFIDYKNSPLECATIKAWLNKVEITTLFNARSTTYRNLKLKDMNLSDTQKEEWLCKENLLIKRPVAELNGAVTVGFDIKTYEKEFLS